MSWHFLQGQEAASWEGSSLDGAPSALLKLIPTPAASCSQGKPMDALSGSPCGMTLPPLTETDGAGVSMSSAVDSLARTCRSQNKAPKGLTGQGLDSGNRWQGSFAKYDRDSSLWRTAQLSLFGGSVEFSETWPRWGLMLCGECFPLRTLEHRTSGSESGYWPTPEASLNIAPFSPKTARNWGGTRPSGAKIGSSLRWWPEFLPDSDAGASWVNPVLCELMMGWPMFWTDCTRSEMDRFRQWYAMHGVTLPQDFQRLETRQ